MSSMGWCAAAYYRRFFCFFLFLLVRVFSSLTERGLQHWHLRLAFGSAVPDSHGDYAASLHMDVH